MYFMLHRRRLRRLAVVLLSVECLLVPSAIPQAETHDNVAWILVIDTSKSMIGEGGAEDIFGRVKSVVKDFIRKAKEGDTVVVYTFDRTPTLVGNVEIKGPLDRLELTQSVDGLDAKGMWTHTGDAVAKAFERSDTIKEQGGNPDKPVAVVIFTDDKEDHEPNSHTIFLSQIQLDREMPFPYTFVVWLNAKSPPAEIRNFVDDLGDRGYLERIQDQSNINDIRDRVLEFLPPSIVMNPSSLLLGSVEPGGTTSPQQLHIRTDKQTSLRVALESEGAKGIALVKPEGTVVLKEGDNDVPVSLGVAPSSSDGIRDVRLILSLDEVSNDRGLTTDKKDQTKFEIAISLNVARVPLWTKALKWFVAIAFTLLIVWVTFYLAAGKHPTEAWLDHFRLEGELTVLNPEDIGGSKHISLKDEKKSRTKLSALQVGRLKEYLNGVDAEFKAVHQNGEKLMNIHSTAGDLYVQEQKVANADLYDGDIIEIGELKLAYAGLNKRPETFD